jgi:hypothetical protein
VPGPELQQRLVDAGQVARVGHHDHRATSRARAGDGRAGYLLRPGRARQRGPRRAGGPAVVQRVEKRQARGVPVPGAGFRSGRRLAPGIPARAGRLVSVRRLFCFGRGVPLRDREAQHVGERPRVPVRDGPRQPGDLGCQHLLGGHHPFQVAEPSLVLAGARALQDEAVGQLSGEPDPYPHPGERLGGEPLWNQVVERPVQVGERDVHRDAGDRAIRRGTQGPRLLLGPAAFALPVRHRPVLPRSGGRLSQETPAAGHGSRNTRARPLAG